MPETVNVNLGRGCDSAKSRALRCASPLAERSGEVVDFHVNLAAVLVMLRTLLRRAACRCRWDGPPTTRRLR
ncbi:hypothetical protein A6A29_29920 [Streptomyces sp. TSRI0281]|nr:hypothetical protein [Streptomyces sp. TSRI0281]OKI45807.1 hypothetical protein A6A29_29920 [Streptomyces sp. TSRI0281]